MTADLRNINMKMADLHIHTRYSDGQAEPASIVRAAKRLGYETIAITDHDGVAGVAEAVSTGYEEGLDVIPGIELDTVTDEGIDLHILGYGMDIDDEDFRRAITELERRRRKRNAGLLRVLADMGYPLSLEELEKLHPGGYVGKPVIARAMVGRGYIDDYKEAFSPGRFLESPEARAVRKEPFSSREAIELIRKAGGTAVLAHPIQARGVGEPGSEEFYDNIEDIIMQLMSFGLEGLECYHPDQDRLQSLRFADMANRHGLWITRGSDFHGADYCAASEND